MSRSAVARRLLRESQVSGDLEESNCLVGAGCGAWMLYTAASAGDLKFVKELLHLRPLLVFGEGDYGLTDMLYAAARSRSEEVFWTLYDFAVSPRFETGEEESAVAGDFPSGFKQEIVNRAVHAAATGGSLVVLTELLAAQLFCTLLLLQGKWRHELEFYARTQEEEKSTADRIGTVNSVGKVIVKMHRRVNNTSEMKAMNRVIVGSAAGQLQEKEEVMDHIKAVQKEEEGVHYFLSEEYEVEYSTDEIGLLNSF